MKFNRFHFILLSLITLSSAGDSQQDVLYKSGKFTVFKDKIVQGNYEARVISPTEISSNYQSPAIQDAVATKRWRRSLDVSKKPTYKSDQPIVDALFNLSVEEALKNCEADSTLRTGALWGGVWTRDISYSIFLAFAYHEPEIAKISLLKKVNRERIIQDTGSGGAWPVSSDRVIWATAAWEIYKVTGDQEWLKRSFLIIKNTIDDDAKTLFDPTRSLCSGESSFLDWREQTYPRWMNNADIFSSENLGTNVAFYNTLLILGEMARLIDEHKDKAYEFFNYAEILKNGIHEHLWLEDKGYYAQYLYGRNGLSVSPRFEALGESLAILFQVADPQKSASIISKGPVTDFGVTCIYPQIPDISPYHNNAIWPFVQSYWNLAAAKVRDENALLHGLASLYRPVGLFLTNYENFVAETGDFKGTAVNSDRMLWSMAGNLAMVHRVFMGMSFETYGLQLNPVIPEAYGGKRTLSDFRYREAILEITVKGFGDRVVSATMDGKPLEGNYVPTSTMGKHSIEIVMNNKSFVKEGFHTVPNHFSLPAPVVELKGTKFEWRPLPGAKHYTVYKNGIPGEPTTQTDFEWDDKSVAEYKVSATDAEGWESFTSEPVMLASGSDELRLELEVFGESANLQCPECSGEKCVIVSTTENQLITLQVNIEQGGYYLLDIRYSNGSGPWNTENKCAIRSLTVNDIYTGVLVFPQRGTNSWEDYGFSNTRNINLNTGENKLTIQLEPWNTNMNVVVNTARLDYIRLIKL